MRFILNGIKYSDTNVKNMKLSVHKAFITELMHHVDSILTVLFPFRKTSSLHNTQLVEQIVIRSVTNFNAMVLSIASTIQLNFAFCARSLLSSGVFFLSQKRSIHSVFRRSIKITTTFAKVIFNSIPNTSAPSPCILKLPRLWSVFS